jgi:hypothetical protein
MGVCKIRNDVNCGIFFIKSGGTIFSIKQLYQKKMIKICKEMHKVKTPPR